MGGGEEGVREGASRRMRGEEKGWFMEEGEGEDERLRGKRGG